MPAFALKDFLGCFRSSSRISCGEFPAVLRLPPIVGEDRELPVACVPHMNALCVIEDLIKALDLAEDANKRLYFSPEYWKLEKEVGTEMRACAPGPLEDAGLHLQRALLRLFFFALTERKNT